jgi:Rps23 Pro-64 3,4-dihydroxylase Tpa1-like proline 4-hydroxylase
MPPQRKITCVFYLGDRADFDPNAAGGELRLYPSPEGGGGSVDVAPLPGRVVIFFSGAVDHEVRTTRTRRAALTLWAR